MNYILGYISMVVVALCAIALYLAVASIANDGACASLKMHEPIGKPLMQVLFVCWW